jgi:hypothetical protein
VRLCAHADPNRQTQPHRDKYAEAQPKGEDVLANQALPQFGGFDFPALPEEFSPPGSG